MTFKSYSDHTEPIFNYLKILNLYKLNEYLTSSFMLRYFHLHTLQNFKFLAIKKLLEIRN